MNRRINNITSTFITICLVGFLVLVAYHMGLAQGQETTIPLQNDRLQDSKGGYWIVEEVLDWETGNGLIPQPASESKVFYIKVRRESVEDYN